VKTERNARRAGDAGDTIPEQANVYVPPRPLAALAEHRTMDVKAIRLAAGVDSRQAPTELRLTAPPLKKDNSWIAPLLLALLAVGFIGLWWITPEPLPLGTTGAKSPASPEVRATAERIPPLAPPRAAPSDPAPSDPALHTAEPPAAPSMPTAATAPTAESTSTAATAPTAESTVLRTPAVAPAPPAPPSANHRAKPGRDPWLE